MSSNPGGSLQLHVRAAAAPTRVVLAAELFSKVLGTAYPDLPAESVTMVVANRQMRAGLRWQDAAGRRAIGEVIEFIQEPWRKVRHNGVWRTVARAIASRSAPLISCGAEFRTPRKLLRPFDTEFVGIMDRIANPRRDVVRGLTIVYSPVLRVGRVSEQARYAQARIMLDGEAKEVQIVSGAEDAFFDAAKMGRMAAIRLHATWVPDEHGELQFDPKFSSAMGIEPWHPTPGADVLQHMQQAPVPLFQNLDEVIDDLEEC